MGNIGNYVQNLGQIWGSRVGCEFITSEGSNDSFWKCPALRAVVAAVPFTAAGDHRRDRM